MRLIVSIGLLSAVLMLSGCMTTLYVSPDHHHHHHHKYPYYKHM